MCLLHKFLSEKTNLHYSLQSFSMSEREHWEISIMLHN